MAPSQSKLKAKRVNLPSFVADASASGRVLTLNPVGAQHDGVWNVTYDDGTTGAKGTPTLEFQGAVTGYQIDKHELPVGFDEVFDAIAI